jgi:hypothetical protein
VRSRENLIAALECLLSRVRRAGRVNDYTFNIRQRFDWDDYLTHRYRTSAPAMTGVFASLTLDISGPFAPIPEPPTRCRCGLTIGHEPTCPELDQ